MKKFIFPLVLLFMTSTLISQKNHEIPITSEKYLQKKKNRNAEAWMLYIGGFTVLGIAALPAFNWSTTAKPFQPIPTTLGAIMVAGSIPLFFSSGANKRKSVALSLKNETVPEMMNSMSSNLLVNNKVPSVSLSIRF